MARLSGPVRSRRDGYDGREDAWVVSPRGHGIWAIYTPDDARGAFGAARHAAAEMGQDVAVFRIGRDLRQGLGMYRYGGPGVATVEHLHGLELAWATHLHVTIRTSGDVVTDYRPTAPEAAVAEAEMATAG